MDARREELERRISAVAEEVYRPVFYRAASATEEHKLFELIERTPTLRVFDQLPAQLEELVRSQRPAEALSPSALHEAVQQHIGDTPLRQYGVWVHYPWSGRLVHLLDEAEFVAVRTDRNRNKITAAEQARLSRSKIGVIGLSVGRSVSVAMALERSFGEIRLADFDRLDLSNLNRIRSGVHELGVNKAVIAAREIATIDPFLKVVCFTDGITADNLDTFLLEGGALDVLVDECDNIALKVRCRIRAKQLRIPVVMDTSDRGLLDIERFDLEPTRPILHGRVEHLDPEKAMQARTREDLLPFALAVSGVDTLSPRMKASMIELQRSISTWPQLATSVLLGGAVTGDVVRRMALGQLTGSGRWYVDLEQLIADAEGSERTPVHGATGLSTEAMLEAAERWADRAACPDPMDAAFALELAAFGGLAPSNGNSQPWRWLHSNGRLFLFLDPGRTLQDADPDLRQACISTGACLQNMLLGSALHGVALHVTKGPFEGAPYLIAILERRGDAQAEEGTLELARHIGQRVTDRRGHPRLPLLPAEIGGLQRALAGTGLELKFVQDPAALAQLARTCSDAEQWRLLDPVHHQALFGRTWRWTTEEAAHAGDGIPIGALGLSAKEQLEMRLVSDPHVAALLRTWQHGRHLTRSLEERIAGSPAVAVLCGRADNAKDRLALGMAVQRVWLKATALGLAVQPLDALFTWKASMQEEATPHWAALCGLLGLKDHGPLFLLRLDRGGPPDVRSPRKPAQALFTVHPKADA